MSSPLAPSALATQRERAIELLSLHFAHDRLSMDELDRRLERAYAATSVAELEALTSDLTLDFRSALLAPGVTDVDVSAVMASVQILVPPGVRVVDRVRALMASVTDDSYGALSPDPSIPIIRLTGYAFMSEVKVRTK